MEVKFRGIEVKFRGAQTGGVGGIKSVNMHIICPHAPFYVFESH